MSGAELERNKAIALRFKKNQGTPQMPQVEKEVLAPHYNRARGGNLHLASNARGEDMGHPGLYLRKAIPDRVDVIEKVIADGDRVGLLFRVTGTHTGTFFGIPPTGKKLDVYEVALIRIENGQMVEGWFMMDEIALLQQMGATLPPRSDGKRIAPPLPQGGEGADALAARLAAHPTPTQQHRNKLVAVRSRVRPSGVPKAEYAPDCRHVRYGFHHLREYGRKNGLGDPALDQAVPDRRDNVEVLMAEGDEVWMRFTTGGTHQGSLYGIAPAGRRVGISVVQILTFAGGKWRESWTFADELGFLLQIGSPDLLLG
ncbi:MAG: ester cyclase [Betaproteobacteria bacterium]|nr:ester cyclase [Betaproteobacteria bacterium]